MLVYRKDIDGLRALAILLVVLYHSFPHFFVGGFIGVDIFFVISGFLIASIISSEFKAGVFSFKKFYLNRIFRLFPSLLTVSLFSILVGWFALSPQEYLHMGNHLTSSLLFYENINLYKEIGYFDVSNELKPFMHLWSLSVEEQFYALFPLLLLIIFKFKLNIKTLLLSFILFSFYLNVHWLNSGAPSKSFFLIQSRFWELGLGAFLSLLTNSQCSSIKLFIFNLVFDKNAFNNPSSKYYELILNNIFPFLGILLIITASFVINEKSKFPGFLVLLPLIGASLIILSSQDNIINKNILSSRIFVFIGLISYPLYLWHWILLSFLKILTSRQSSLLLISLTLLISFILSIITFYFIEKPFKKFKNLTKKLLLIFIPFLLCLFLLFSIKYYDGYPNRLDAQFIDNSERSWLWWTKKPSNFIFDTCENFQKIETGIKRICWRTQSPNLLLIGDSHAGALTYGLAHSKDPFFNKISLMGAGGCPPTSGYERWNGCGIALDEAFDYLGRNPSVSYVLISTFKAFIDDKDPDSKEKHLFGFRNTIKRLINSKKNIVFIIDNPIFDEKKRPALCAPMELPLKTFFTPIPDFCRKPSIHDLQSYPEYEDIIKTLKVEFPDVLFYDASNRFINGDDVKIFTDHKLLYDDWGHLSIYGSEYIADDLINQIMSKFNHKIK